MQQTTTPVISVDEYLHTDYENGDREYVDGVVVERNVGEKSHSRVQRAFIELFAQLRKSLRTWAFPEQRVQVRPTRFRIPDVCVYIDTEPEEEIFRTPPFLAIEIVSPRDTFSSIQEKTDDYLACGTPFVWVVEPKTRRAYIYTPDSIREVKDGVLRTANPYIEIPLRDLF